MTFNEEELLATLYLNLGGPKRKKENWMDLAYKCKKLVDLYGSAHIVAEKIGVSYELIRALIVLTTLPEEVQNYIKNNEILFDAAQRLARIPNKETQKKVANLIVGMPSHDARQIIQFAVKYPYDSMENFKDRVVNSKDKIKKINLIIFPIDNDKYEFLKIIGSEQHKSPDFIIQDIINNWIENKKRGIKQ